MPLWPTPNNTSQPWIPGTTEPEKIPRQWRVFQDLKELNDAIEIERDNIEMGAAIWAHGEVLKVVAEPLGSYRTWYIDSALINLVQRAAASNAWRASIGNLSVTLLDDDGQLRSGSGAPAASLGLAGDWYANYTSGELLRKNRTGTWDIITEGQGPRIAPPLLELSAGIPAVGQTFSAFMASRNKPAHTAIAFGTGAVAPTGATNVYAIRNHVELAERCDPLQAGTAGTTLNSEMQVYPWEFNNENHQLTTDRLILRAKLNSGATWQGHHWSQPDGNRSISLTPGATLPWDRLTSATFPAGYDLRNGQVWALYGKGAYVVTDVVQGVSFKLLALSGGKTTGTHVYNSIVMSPIESAVATTVTSNSGITIQFAPGALHQNIQPGYRVAVSQADRVLRQAADVWVTEVNHSTGLVTLNRNMPIGNAMPTGSRFLFYPRISAGQFWTKEGWNIYGDTAFLAVKGSFEMFAGLSTTANTHNISGASAYNALNNVHPDMVWGAWTAFWMYGHTMGGGTPGTNEIDINETWVSGTEGLFRFSTGVLGPGVGAVIYQKRDDGYGVASSGKNTIPFSIVGDHEFALIYLATNATTAHTYHYIDDVLVKIETFRWMTPRYVQIGVNIAMGWLSAGGASNINLPVQTSHFQRATKAVKSLTVWHGA